MKTTKALLIILIITLKNTTCFAQWNTDTFINNPICTVQNDQNASKIVSDGSGGAIIVWYDYRNGTSNGDLYAQRINSNGVIQWTPDGIPICTAPFNQTNLTVISDGNGGAIIAWNDKRTNNFDSNLYVQKISSSGVTQWNNNGIAICSAPFAYNKGEMIPDGNGGLIIAWPDSRSLDNTMDIYAQYINSAGIAQWTTDGVLIYNNPTNASNFIKIVSDGSNGAIITWQDARNVAGFDIYAQRVNSSGVTQWTNNGIVICNATDSQAYPAIISDNNGGAIITWSDLRNSATSASSDIYAQRVNSNGIVQWTNNGIAICNSINGQNSSILVSDNNGGAIITWEDRRTSANSADLYAQRINSNGIVQWTTNGVPISATAYNQWYQEIIPDGNGGAIIAWADYRNGTNNGDIYAQRINSTGVTQWTTNGAAISTASNSQSSTQLILDDNGGAIITWTDYRSGTNNDIYAQRINMNGNLSVTSQSIHETFLNIFPNPSKGNITFQSAENLAEIQIINQLGETVYKKNSVNSNKKELDLGNLADGIYIYNIISENNIISNGKLIIAH
ncbi:T9SS type A sorting domain-containing protein [Flavobacterium enshiense]|uniref:T9SS type A sorting domain-containing protein n=1 Tax=Flavobacterium enshiense TaxID=1341165 RepID=UPI00345D26D4